MASATLCTCRWGQKVELQTTWLVLHYVHVGGDKDMIVACIYGNDSSSVHR